MINDHYYNEAKLMSEILERYNTRR